MADADKNPAERKPIMIRLVGAIAALLGIGIAIEGGILVTVGGTPAYLIGGLLYIVVGGLLIARIRAAFWLHLALFAAVLGWTFWETGFSQWTVFTAIPRLDVSMVIAILVMLPWVWRATDVARIPALTPGVVSIGFFIAGCLIMWSMPWVYHPNGDPSQYFQASNNGGSVTLPQTDIKPGNWPSWGRTLGQSRYSPLDHINAENVSKLEKAWVYESGDMQHTHNGFPHWGAEATPIKIGDTLYTCTPNAWVIALNPATGEQKWKFKPTSVNEELTNFVNCRGVSYYKAPKSYTGPHGGDLCKTRIIAPTMGPYIVALDAETGKKCPRFGDHGMIDLTQNIGHMAPGTLVQTSAPLVMNNKVYTGGNVYDNWYWKEPSGVVRAWDAITGKLVWHWDLGKADPNASLAPGETYTHATPNVWGRITGDPEHDLVFLPTGNATPDYANTKRRPFDKKYSGSIVALNADTGQELWHFQESYPIDTWDFDIPVGPTLVQWPDGKGGFIPALVSTNKRGQIFVLNRLTGKPIRKIVEKEVPSAPEDSPVYNKNSLSDTQPFSIEEPQFSPDKLEESDMWGMTPFDQMWCRIRYNELYYKGPFTPPTLQGSIMYPTFDGVSDWYGAAYGPKGTMNAVSNYLPFVGTLVPRIKSAHASDLKVWNGIPPVPPWPKKLNPQYGLKHAIHLHPFLSPIQMPCSEPPWATLSQVDLARGKIIWRTPLGNSRHTAPFGYKQFLPLPTSTPDLGSGIMTAGGVTFIAGTADNMLRAYNTKTGEVLWSTYLPAGGQANPAIYKANGREYVVITAGGHQPLGTIRGDYTIAFALPEDVAQGDSSPASHASRS